MLMVQKKEEMNDSGVNGGNVATFSVSPQEKGRKNKRKLADPSQQNAANLPSPLAIAASLTEFPRYELPLLNLSSNPSDPSLIGTASSPPKVEESESVGWDDPVASHLEELLSSNLVVLFQSAISQIVDCGFSEDVAMKAISGSGLYCGGNDLAANVANDTLNYLKNGKESAASRGCVFENLEQLVEYTLVEMINLVREVRPSLSTVEVMWRLLMCDMNVLLACEVEGDRLEGPLGFNSTKSSESSGAECNHAKPSGSDNLKPPLSNSHNNQSEPLKFGNFPNLPNSKNSHASATTPGKEVFSGRNASGEGIKSSSLTSVSDEKLLVGRKGRTKKEIAMLRQKSCVEKIKTYTKSGGYKTAKFASVGGFLVEKRVKSPSDLAALHARNSSSKITAEIGGKVLSAESSSILLTNTSKSDLPVVDSKSCILALPASSPEPATPAPSASDKKSSSESEQNASVSIKPTLDYYAGIPYDATLGIYVPGSKKDELILKLVPRLKYLQNELQAWTEWANKKVRQATGRLLKDQPELKALKKESEEAEQCKKEKQLVEENTMKRLSEMEFALNNATNQLEKANHSARELELEQSLLKQRMEAARAEAAETAEECREAKERGQRAVKEAQSWDGERLLLQEEIKTERDKMEALEKELSRAKIRQSQIEATRKQEAAAVEKLVAQAAAIKKEKEQLESSGRGEEERVKRKAENDVKYYMENIKGLETELWKLKVESDCLRIAALKKGNEESGNMGAKPKQTESKGEAKEAKATKIKRERECVMCLSEEMTVIFLPCAHQVLCSKCNGRHEREGMKDCPSCRATIMRRIQARFGHE